ncbi:biotin/lipoyl-binding protein [Pedobacter sp. SL55]|uniref:biotin/lipoyl-binding protein n=1 Tax=Pedobacter sp. SL55 TaxID=2995161 RepID=UPI0022718BC6|nr:biotin/lipoyl-binding protein [Pedobacter sp. SL55]WAC42189.1 biotin/lipoyl-binding protein [Pedobacter sp. SL55]
MKKRGKIDELDNTDEPIKEILGRVPSWIVQWGNTLILIFFVSIVIISFIIKYPEVTYTNAKIVSINAPKAVVSRVSGKLVQINFKEDTPVRKGDLIGFLESVANHEQVLALYNELKVMNNDFVNNNQKDLDTRLFEIAHNELGELQQSFQAFFQAYLTYKNYMPGALYEEKEEDAFSRFK